MPSLTLELTREIMFTKDLLYAARSLAKSPVFLVTAVLTIALGIGASTAIFSVTNAVLLRPLPYKDPERLIIACGDMRKRNVKDFPFSNAEYFDLREAAKNSFEDFSGRLHLPWAGASWRWHSRASPHWSGHDELLPLDGRQDPCRTQLRRCRRATASKEPASGAANARLRNSFPLSPSSAMNIGSAGLAEIRPYWANPSSQREGARAPDCRCARAALRTAVSARRKPGTPARYLDRGPSGL